MAIESPGDTFFPYNVIAVLENACAVVIDPGINYERRRLTTHDPDGTVGIAPVSWNPIDQEIGVDEATLQLYMIFIQTLIVDTDEARGLQTHSYFAKRMREMLVRHKPLRVALGSLQTTDSGGVVERVLKVSVGEQIFHSAEADGNWRYLSTLELRLETQIGN